MIGETIGHYTILEKLGEGGMGIVYKAQDTKLDRVVALKFLPHHLTANESELARFVQEAKAAAALNHPNIATIHAIEEADDETFIAMEHVEGHELKERIAQGPLPIKEALSIATQIAEGLQAAHKKDIVHRDVKSANIMLTDTGRVKIMDFGLAKMKGNAQLTKMGTTVGTAAYMSPEQARGDEVDHRADIWSLGVVMYEMLTGRLPFKSDYDQAAIYSILNEQPEFLTRLRPEVPDRVQEAVFRALAKDPAKRFQTAEEMLTALRSSDMPAREKSQLTSEVHPGKVFTFRLWHAGALLLLTAAAALYFLRTAEQEITTLAILPFVNQSGNDEMEYLSDGIAETLIFKLSQLPNLTVRSLNSVSRFRGTSPDLRKAGRDLNVQSILTGRVAVRRDKLAIVVELVNTNDNSTIWGETYNRTLADLLSVQDEISNNILTRLQIELTDETRPKVSRGQTDNLEAYNAYLKGRHFIQRRNDTDLNKAISYFEEATSLAPRYAVAYAGLAQAHFLRGTYGFASRDEVVPKVQQAAKKAFEIDESLAEAHVALALLHAGFLLDFAKSETALRRAIEFDARNADAHHHMSYVLSYTGRNEEAIRHATIALELEPLSPVMTRGLGLVYFLARQNEKAVRYYQECLEIDPGSLSATFFLVFVYQQMGLPEKSIAMLERYFTLIDEKTHATRIRETYKRSGYHAAILDLLSMQEAGFLRNLAVKSFLYATISEKEKSLEYLQKAYEQGGVWLSFANALPVMDVVRSDPRYIVMMEKVFGKK